MCLLYYGVYFATFFMKKKSSDGLWGDLWMAGCRACLMWKYNEFFISKSIVDEI